VLLDILAVVGIPFDILLHLDIHHIVELQILLLLQQFFLLLLI
jgi:hypothetical protein